MTSSAVPEPASGSQEVSETTVTRPFYWSVQRELWENRYLYLAPLFVAGVVVFASLMNLMINLPKRVRTLSTLDATARHYAVVTPLTMAPAPIMLATFIIGIYYCLDALYGERRDRSILFWKSLPVSDRTTVLSKAAIPFVVMPLIAIALSLAALSILLIGSTFILLVNGLSPASVWTEIRFIAELVVMFYGMAVHALWFAPIYGWLLLVSAWSKRAPFLWAVLPLLAISAVERIVFNSWHFMKMLQYRLTGAMKEAFSFAPNRPDSAVIDNISELDPAGFLGTPALWVGLVFAVLCLVAATRLRRNREPI